MPSMDTFMDSFISTIRNLDVYLRENYSFVADYLPTSLVTFLMPYVNVPVPEEELKEKLPMMILKSLLVSLLFCSITFYIFIRCYLSSQDPSSTDSDTEDTSSSSEDDDDDSIEIPFPKKPSNDKKQESTA